MPSFTLSEEQRMLVDTIRRFAVNDLQKQAHDNDEMDSIPHDTILKGWELGLLPASIPEEWEGFGEYSAVTSVLALEELAYGDLAAAIKIMTPSLVAYPILFNGTPEQKGQFLPLFMDETPCPATAALLEPGIMFDPFELKTTVTCEEGLYVINGQKAYVPVAEGAEHILVYARDTENGEQAGYLVEKGTEGLIIEKREKLMGIRALDSYRVKLNNVKVTPAARIGNPGEFNYQKVIDHTNMGLAAMAVGVARAAYEYARDYAKERVQFGKPIASKQAIAFLLANCAIEVDSARLLVWDAAWHVDTGKKPEKITRAAYLARQYADKTVLFVGDSSVQILGGYGFIREYPVERYLRNGRGFPTFTGLAMA